MKITFKMDGSFEFDKKHTATKEQMLKLERTTALAIQKFMNDLGEGTNRSFQIEVEVIP